MDYHIGIPSGKDKKQYLEQASKCVAEDGIKDMFHKKSDLRSYSQPDHTLLVYQKKVVFIIEKSGRLIPSIHLLRAVDYILPKIVVDVGAIKFVANGADIMRPGITHIDDDIQAGDLVVITEERNNGILGVGEAKDSANSMQTATSGKVIKNIHHLKDEYWSFTP